MTYGMNNLQWHDTPKSQNIRRIAHTPTNVLHIEFKKPDGTSNGSWSYAGVTPQQFEEMKKAPSVGGHFRRNVRGKFNTTRTYLT